MHMHIRSLHIQQGMKRHHTSPRAMYNNVRAVWLQPASSDIIRKSTLEWSYKFLTDLSQKYFEYLYDLVIDLVQCICS